MRYENNIKTQHETRSEKFELQQPPFLLQKNLTKKLNMKTIAPTISHTTHKHLSLVASLSNKTTHNKIATSSLSHTKKSVENPKRNQNSSLKPLHVCPKSKNNQNQNSCPR
jgi:hypothetical protein